MLQAQISDQNESLERYKERLTNFSGEFELGLFLFIGKRSLFWIACFFGIAFGGAWLYLRYSQNVYESSCVLKIDEENNAKVLDVKNMYEVNNEDELASAVEVIRSKVFLKRVLSKLPVDVSYYAEGRIKTNEHYRNSPYKVGYTINDAGFYGTRVNIKFNSTSDGGELSFASGGKQFDKKFSNNTWVDFPQVSLLLSIDTEKLKKMLQGDGATNNYYFVINNPDDLADAYYPRLSVSIDDEAAKTIHISFTDNNALKTYDIVHTIANEYIDYDLERRSESAKKVLAFIDEEIKRVSSLLQASEDSIRKFRDSLHIHDNESFNAFNMERYGSLEDQLTKEQMDDFVYSEIEAKLNDKNLKADTLLSLLAGTENGQALSTSINNIYQLITARTEALFTMKPGSDEVKAYDYQIEIQKNLLMQSVRALREQAGIRIQALQSKMDAYKSRLPSTEEDPFEYTGLKRLYGINEDFFTMLMQKKYEYTTTVKGISKLQTILEEPKIPAVPQSPRKSTTIITAILVAILAGLILVILRYVMHDSISSLNEIMKQTQATISALGIIPKYKEEVPVSQLLVDRNPKSLIAESFRSLRSNLQFISNTPGPKIMAITSTISGEGKTFVAINLAGIIAYSGKKVIILDLDMRKPKIHQGFKVANEKGMSTLLIGKDDLRNCIRKSSLEDLDFITAGPVPPNPSELIIGPRMPEILDELKKEYDLIIIDNPPVGLVTDGIATIQLADYPVYVFRADYSKRAFIQIVDRLYNENNIKKLSVVLNGVDIDRRNYGYNYGYGYSYGYGYGYGYYDDTTHGKPGFFKRLFRGKH